jgi:hypothetical protein
MDPKKEARLAWAISEKVIVQIVEITKTVIQVAGRFETMKYLI